MSPFPVTCAMVGSGRGEDEVSDHTFAVSALEYADITQRLRAASYRRLSAQRKGVGALS